MKRFFAVFLLFLFSVNLFADDDDKQKLAVMEFEDLSGKLSPQMLSGATEYIRGAFVSSNKFIVIAKERQEKAMIKEMKKESYKSCNDKNCQIPLGQALSADTILRTTINFFGGTYTITSELIDLAKEATVSGAKQSFDGSERSLMQALDRIVVQITGSAVSYDISAMQTREIKGVKLGGVELDTMPKIEIKEADFGDVKSSFSVGELESGAGVSLDADADVLVQYDKCVEIDKKAQNSPVLAINCWKKLASMSEGNPFISQAEKRVEEWEKFVRTKKLADLFEEAKTADKSGQIFPNDAMSAWREIGKEKSDNPYYQTALERYNFWKQYKAQVDKYSSQLKKFEEQRKQDTAKLKKVLPLKVITDAQKRTVLVQYMEIYAPFYGIEDVNDIIYSLDKSLAQHLYGLLYNDYLKKEMAEKCGKGSGAACYISASLIKSDNPAQSLKYSEKSCEKGIVEACVETGKTYYDSNKKKEAAKHFYDACGMKSPEGCQLAGYVTERGEGTEKDIPLAKKIYQLVSDMGYKVSSGINGCYFGYEEACKGGKLVSKKAESSQKSDKTSMGKQAQDKKQSSGETYRPYKAAGISLIVVGAVVTVAGVAGFHIASDEEYDKYKKFKEYSTAENYVGSWSKEKYVSEANKHRNKSNTYRILEITSGIIGGAAFVTGIALTAIKKEKPRNVSLTNISVTPSNKGFYAFLGFEF
ncbi:sel1 repeat family protein [bacterium]|nr:sel1 repeat family protein [bacterium]